MKIEYYDDTDTLVLAFSKKVSARTEIINDNMTLDWDDEGKLISIDIEHARENVRVNHLIRTTPKDIVKRHKKIAA